MDEQKEKELRIITTSYAKNTEADWDQKKGLLLLLSERNIRNPVMDWLADQLKLGLKPSYSDLLGKTMEITSMAEQNSQRPIIKDGKTLDELCGKDPITKSLIADWRARNISDEAIWQFLEDN